MGLNVKYRTIKLLEDIYIGENPDDLGYNTFLTITAKNGNHEKKLLTSCISLKFKAFIF